MQRVMIVGQPGAGKSWLAREMGRIIGLPVHHMDSIHFLPGWIPRPADEKIEMARAVERGESWIFEGGLSATYDTRMQRCDTLVILDMPLLLRVYRVGRRTLRDHGRTRPELPEDCPERFDPEFWRWIWQTRNTHRQELRRLPARAPAHVRVHHLRTPREVRHFLETIRPGSPA